jgi:anthranilate synthase/aminodeoxychorismate synthase-like glutamine amidotransferase
MLVMIDNYDSFTFNVVRYLEELGAEVVVKRNDEITLDHLIALAPQALIISPGPCSPDQAGISLAAIVYFSGRIPILGVCLGHQAIAQSFGAKVRRAEQPMHGKTSLIKHNGQGLFAHLPPTFSVARYHSLTVDAGSLPSCLRVDAWVGEGHPVIMALSHVSLPIHGIQFHPESVLSEQGHALFNSFLLHYGLVTNHGN